MRSIHLALALALVATPPCAAVEGVPPSCKMADKALAQGQLEEALIQYQTCVKEGPPRFETLTNLGIVQARLLHFDEAIKTYQQALALNPENPQANLNLGIAFVKTERYKEGVKALARALLAQPENIQAQELLAFCHYQLEQYELAALEAERVWKAKPGEASTAFILGSAYLKMGLYGKAIPFVDLAMRKMGSAETHVVMGEAYRGVRAFGDALTEFSRALALRPDMPGLHAEIGATLVGMGDTDRAMPEFEQELQRNPNDFQANYYMGRLKRLTNDFETAKKYLAMAEQLRPGDPSVIFENAVFAFQAKDYPKAEAMLKEILEKHPDFTDAHVLLAEVYFKTRRREEGVREKAVVDTLRKEEQAREAGPDKSAQTSGGRSPKPLPPH